MKLDLLTAISPIDGRYRGKTERLADYFSEYALIRYRVRVEIEYFITLCELPLPQLASFDHQLFDQLRDIYRNFGEEEAQRVKDIEKVTNHDVKAVEYFIKEEFDRIGGLDYQGGARAVLLPALRGAHRTAPPVCRGVGNSAHARKDTRTARFAYTFGQGGDGVRIPS